MLATTTVELGQGAGGYVKPAESIPTVTLRLSEVPTRPVENYCQSGLKTVLEALNNRINQLGIVGVISIIPNSEIAGEEEDEAGRDMRAGRTDLKVTIFTATVAGVRTLAFGKRIPFEYRVNNPRHLRIRQRSPVQPAVRPDDPDRRDLVLKDEVDEYVLRLSRHPGRRVDVAVAPGEVDGTVTLDYLVAENKPWLLYSQVSNTGTEQTDVWRERFGFIHNQLTGSDDVLSVDYITAGFSEAHSLTGSYERPLLGLDKLRWRAFGNWNEYTASDVGFANEQFKGDGWYAGAELLWNFFQKGEWFLDLVGGAHFDHVHVQNELIASEGESDFFIPYIGLRLDRTTDVSSLLATVNLQASVSGIPNDDELDELGRLGTDGDWTALQWDIAYSFYLEPLLIPKKWREVNTRFATLAHEVALSFKGQYAFDARLVPNYEIVVGGLYTVRGYEESVAAGDGAVIFSGEYRFHLPRALPVNPNPRKLFPWNEDPFRWTPQVAYGQTDWDLILRTFVDVGQTIISDSPFAEDEETLVGTGVGGEFLFRRNFSVRVDWGVALDEVESAGVKAGSNRFHIMATILF